MRVLTVVIAIAAAILILLGYISDQFAGIQTLLLNWALILVGAATLVGVLNLLFVHADKIRRGEKGSVYSALLIVFMVATLLFGIILGPEHETMKLVLDAIIIPVEATLMAILSVTLIYAAIRLLRRRIDVMSVLFLLTAVLVILGSATLPFGDMPIIGTLVRPWFTQVLALGGARGILIGIALGTLTTGLRVLFGVDRPYGGN